MSALQQIHPQLKTINRHRNINLPLLYRHVSQAVIQSNHLHLLWFIMDVFKHIPIEFHYPRQFMVKNHNTKMYVVCVNNTHIRFLKSHRRRYVFRQDGQRIIPMI